MKHKKMVSTISRWDYDQASRLRLMNDEFVSLPIAIVLKNELHMWYCHHARADTEQQGSVSGDARIELHCGNVFTCYNKLLQRLGNFL